MAIGLLRVETHPGYNASPVLEMCCFFVASVLLILPLSSLWKARRDNLRLLALLWVVGFQELVCITESLKLAVRAVRA